MGLGVSKNYEKAVEWYNKSAEQGNMQAQYNLGIMYEDGIGVPQSNEKAMEWYRKAAAQGYSEAKEALQRLQGGK